MGEATPLTAPLVDAMLLHNSRPWYATKEARGAIVVGLAMLLVVILAGPRPKVKSDLVSDAPAGIGAATRSAAAGSSLAAGSAAEGLVHVGFYGESLCPDCQHMVRDVLQPMFDSGVHKLMKLTYHAFGNVRNASGGGFAYQHGDAEGKYNRFMLCAQHQHPDQEEWFPYVKCMADNMHSLASKTDGCAAERGWEAEAVSGCADGPKGKELELVAAAATWALNPDKNFVPWILVNGVAIGNDFEHLASYVCAASPPNAARPDACYTLPADRAHMGRRRS